MKKIISQIIGAFDLPIVDALGSLFFLSLAIYVGLEYCCSEPHAPSVVFGVLLMIASSIWGSFLTKVFKKKEA